MNPTAMLQTFAAALALLLAPSGAALAQLGPGPCEDPAAAAVCGGEEAPAGGFTLIDHGHPAAVLTIPACAGRQRICAKTWNGFPASCLRPGPTMLAAAP